MSERSPQWVASLNAILVGWNIGLLGALIVGVAILTILANTMGNLQSSAGLVLVLASALVVGALAGWYSARKMRPWFTKRSKARAYLWLAVVAIVTLTSIPAPFNFVVF